MKARSFKYLLGEGIKNLWLHRLMTLASVGVLIACMLMMGIAVMLSFNIDQIVDNLEDQNVVMVFFNDNQDRAVSQASCNSIKDIDNVKEVTFISKEEGLARQQESMGDEYKELFEWVSGENPLPDAAQVVVEDINQFDQTIIKLKAIDGVQTVRDQRNITSTLASIRSIVTKGGVWIIIILLIISLMIVSNTVKITMFTRKLEINIMKGVGATNGFIRLPFVIEGMVIGLIASVLSTGLLYLIYRSAEKTFFETFNASFVPFGRFALYIFCTFLIMGVLIGAIGSALSIRKYLRYEGSDFNAID